MVCLWYKICTMLLFELLNLMLATTDASAFMKSRRCCYYFFCNLPFQSICQILIRTFEMSLKFINANIIRVGKHQGNILGDKLFKAKNGFILDVSRASITSKAFREERLKPAPFPYKEKSYSFLRSLFDKTTPRFDENSKIIVVEGSIAVGKTKFARELAKELDFYHIEDANMDIRYINKYGCDLKKLDNQLPLSMQSYDEKKFCKEPKHLNTAAFQIWMYRLRFSLYIDALAHIFNTGQGVVIERSPWSDLAFAEAMYKNNYISKNAKKGYMEVRKNTISQLLRPHLIIYLDASVAKVKENIKNRGHPYEQNSPALTDQYLQDLEDMFKTEYLATFSPYAELLMYDWSEEGDVEVVVEDIERIDFEGYTKYDEKFVDWFIGKEQDWAAVRHKYTEQKDQLLHLFNVPFLDAPELIVSGEDLEDYNKIVYNHPEFQYAEGFHPNHESGLLFRVNESRYVKY